jgi:hypothetical protein
MPTEITDPLPSSFDPTRSQNRKRFELLVFEKKAQELASSGNGDNVRLAPGRATVDDVLNSESISV